MPELGTRPLKFGNEGDDVAELQLCLAGFLGGVPDGQFGHGTEGQVKAFQRDWMKREAPDGRADELTFKAIANFAAVHPIDFKALACDCGPCGGFGRGLFKGKYSGGSAQIEKNYLYEYPGVHRMLLWAFRGAMFYCGQAGYKVAITSGYRCSENNRINNRVTTNHHGKAIDFALKNAAGKEELEISSDRIRTILTRTANAQISWDEPNRKSLEPPHDAPIWVHYDVRSYAARYLEDRYFVKTSRELDGEAAAAIV